VPRAIFQCSGETGHLPGEALLSASTRNSRRLTILQQIHEPALVEGVFTPDKRAGSIFFQGDHFPQRDTPSGGAGVSEVLSDSSITELTH